MPNRPDRSGKSKVPFDSSPSDGIRPVPQATPSKPEIINNEKAKILSFAPCAENIITAATKITTYTVIFSINSAAPFSITN